MEAFIGEDKRSTEIDKCCGTCCFWMKLSQYEGVCVSDRHLSGSLDTTEVRYVCEAWER